MLSCCRAHLMASFEMLEPCALAYSAACLHAAFTSSGAGCHSGGPWRQRILSKGRIHTVPAQCCTLMGCMQRFGDAFIELMLLLQYRDTSKEGRWASVFEATNQGSSFGWRSRRKDVRKGMPVL